jgi:hypothetical protein
MRKTCLVPVSYLSHTCLIPVSCLSHVCLPSFASIFPRIASPHALLTSYTLHACRLALAQPFAQFRKLAVHSNFSFPITKSPSPILSRYITVHASGSITLCSHLLIDRLLFQRNFHTFNILNSYSVQHFQRPPSNKAFFFIYQCH